MGTTYSRYTATKREEDRWTFLWNPPGTPKSVRFTLIQSTHSKETHTTAASALHYQFYSNIRVSLCGGDGRISCVKALRHRLVQSYIVEIIASTCCTSQLQPPPHLSSDPHPTPPDPTPSHTPHTLTHTQLPTPFPQPQKANTCQCAHTQHKTTCLALKWEQWWGAVTAPRPRRGEVGSADQPSVAQNGFWDSSSPSDGQPDFLGCVGTLRPPAPCSILIVGRNAHRQPTLFARQKLKWGEKKKKSEYTVHWGTQTEGTLIFKTEKSDQEHSTELVD